MEHKVQRGLPRLTAPQYIVILVLSALLSSIVVIATASYFPPFGSILMTLFVVTMCVLVSHMSKDEHFSRTILLTITFVVAITPYIIAYSFVRVPIEIVNGTNSTLGNVIVSYPWYTEHMGNMFQGVEPGEAISVDACILYGNKEITIRWNDENQTGMEGSSSASYSGDFRNERPTSLILLGESDLVSNRVE